MSLLVYPEYKDSGVAWLGKIPVHWQQHQSRRLFEQRRDPSLPADEQLSATQKYGVIPQRLFMVQEDQKVVLALSGLDNFKHVQPDDFVISLRSFQGGIERSRYEGCVSPAYTVLRPQSGLVARFWEYLLKSSQYIAALQTATDGIRDGKNISYAQFGALCVPLPPAEEQTAIATFLDRETGKIDALIAEQEKLLTLLAEKRQATISHAVTKGLNPDAPMKDSGVAWLGEVPAHWEIKQLRHIAKIVRGASPRPAGDPKFFSEDAEGNTPWVTVAEVTKDMGTYLDSVKEYLTPLGVEQSQLFDCGTLVFTNSGATLGVPKILAINCCANDGILAFRDLVPTVNIVFAYSFLLTTTERLRTEMKQGGGQPNLNTDIVKNIGFALPPLNEQSEIVAFLSQELERLDALASEANRGIALLKERRSALIAAAVTGQIDVRGLVTELEAA